VVTADPHWWRQAVVYQIYPRSFTDSDGDGIGDLKGVLTRVPYLSELGVEAVWLSPFYPSALADGGYDVVDYRDVDPRLGTLEDFDELVTSLHAVGIRILVDIVANHSSNAHAWFQAALSAPAGSRERDRYIFRDGRGANGELPPNDWPSHFGPSAWTRTADPDGTPGQWYLHLFAPEQPDLNWDHPDVMEEFLTTLRFWADRGVDGFRIDAAHLLKKDLAEPYPRIPSLGDITTYPTDGSHPLVDRDEVHDIYRVWRSVLDEYTPPRAAVAETAVVPSRRALYARPDELGQAFDFDLLDTPWNARAFRETIARCLDGARISGSSPTWTLSNHDAVRQATRYGLPAGADLNRHLLSDGTEPVLDRELGLRRARAAALLMLALPGSVYLYQGEELGLPEVADLPVEVLQDPVWIRDRGARKGRDGCRVPIPWATTGRSFGFGPAGSHLPMPAWFSEYAVERQDGAPGSTLELYRAALRMRHDLQATETLTWHDGPDDVVWFARANGWQCVPNAGREPVALPRARVLLASAPLPGDELPGNTTAWLRA
jgi:alpha-glucosidase